MARRPVRDVLLRHEQRVQELLEANNRLVAELRSVKAIAASQKATLDYARTSARAIREENRVLRDQCFVMAATLVGLGREVSNKVPCGECHLDTGEVCDICGAASLPSILGGPQVHG